MLQKGLPTWSSWRARWSRRLGRAASSGCWCSIRTCSAAPERATASPRLESAVETVTDEQAQIRAAAESKPLSEVLTPLQRDPLTVVDDRTFLDRIAAQPNLPDYVKQGLPDLY